jgi:hypothetical protein
MNDAMDSYPRWRAAEASERDDDADEAFRTVFQSVVQEQPMSLEFTARTMTAIAGAAAVDTRRARHARLAVLSGSLAATAAAVYVGAGWAIALVSAAFLGLLNLLVAAVVRTAEAFQTGAGVWGVLSSLGRATAAVAADSNVTFAMIAISAVAIAALVALQRLLGSDEESFQ